MYSVSISASENIKIINQKEWHRPEIFVKLLLLCAVGGPATTTTTTTTTTARQEVDLVRSLHLHNSSFSGLDVQPGPHSSSPALQFSGDISSGMGHGRMGRPETDRYIAALFIHSSSPALQFSGDISLFSSAWTVLCMDRPETDRYIAALFTHSSAPALLFSGRHFTVQFSMDRSAHGPS